MKRRRWSSQGVHEKFSDFSLLVCGGSFKKVMVMWHSQFKAPVAREVILTSLYSFLFAVGTLEGVRNFV